MLDVQVGKSSEKPLKWAAWGIYQVNLYLASKKHEIIMKRLDKPWSIKFVAAKFETCRCGTKGAKAPVQPRRELFVSWRDVWDSMMLGNWSDLYMLQLWNTSNHIEMRLMYLNCLESKDWNMGWSSAYSIFLVCDTYNYLQMHHSILTSRMCIACISCWCVVNLDLQCPDGTAGNRTLSLSYPASRRDWDSVTRQWQSRQCYFNNVDSLCKTCPCKWILTSFRPTCNKCSSSLDLWGVQVKLCEVIARILIHHTNLTCEVICDDLLV